jgi:hypothetical protein
VVSRNDPWGFFQALVEKPAYSLDSIHDIRSVFLLTDIECQITIVNFRIAIEYQRKLHLGAKILSGPSADIQNNLTELRKSCQVSQNFLLLGHLDLVKSQPVQQLRKAAVANRFLLRAGNRILPLFHELPRGWKILWVQVPVQS